jgi:predicted RNA-binding protein Jag
MINKNSEIKYKLQLEINDYKNSKDDRLFQFIQSKINEVKRTGTTCILPYYN